MRKLSDIADYVNQLTVDLKAETLIALIQNDFTDSKDILSVFDGQLKRTYAKDISSAEIREFESGEQAVAFHLNRDGIYDALPEALFHSFSEEAPNKGDEMARDSMKLKNEEKEARLFFQPLEDQIFSQLVRLAKKENMLFSDMYSSLLQGLIPDFWKINKEIPKEYKERLVRLIPMAHKIVGDLSLTKEAFEFVLKEMVSIDFYRSESGRLGGTEADSSGGGLGECLLGINTFSGDKAEIPIGKLRVSLGPICYLDIRQYIAGGWLKTLLDCMYSYFIPMEFVVDTEIVPSVDKLEFNLNEENSENVTYLGYNSVLSN